MPQYEEKKIYIRGRRLFCRKNFRFNGRDFKIHELFPANRLAIADVKVQSMINGNYLTHEVPPKDANKAVYNHRGGGWFDVRLGGVKLNSTPIRKAAAVKLVAAAKKTREE